MPLFYSKHIDTSSPFLLSEEESRHAVKALRLSMGDTLKVTSGNNDLFICKITAVHKKHCEIEVFEKGNIDSTTLTTIQLIVAPTKNQDRMEWMVEKCTEIGVHKISFIQTEHSERTKLRMDRMERTAIAAMKQSQRLRLPQIENIDKYLTVVSNNASDVKYIAHKDLENNESLYQILNDVNKSLSILIGPEGDFSNKEIELAKGHGFKSVNLGKYRLRTETAAIAACQILNSFYE